MHYTITADVIPPVSLGEPINDTVWNLKEEIKVVGKLQWTRIMGEYDLKDIDFRMNLLRTRIYNRLVEGNFYHYNKLNMKKNPSVEIYKMVLKDANAINLEIVVYLA